MRPSSPRMITSVNVPPISKPTRIYVTSRISGRLENRPYEVSRVVDLNVSSSRAPLITELCGRRRIHCHFVGIDYYLIAVVCLFDTDLTLTHVGHYQGRVALPWFSEAARTGNAMIDAIAGSDLEMYMRLARKTLRTPSRGQDIGREFTGMAAREPIGGPHQPVCTNHNLAWLQKAPLLVDTD